MSNLIAESRLPPPTSRHLPPVDRSPPEAFIAWLWQHHLAGGRWLEAAGLPPTRLVYPGARAGGRGPDFRGALLVTAEGRLLQGDVEVHQRTSDWEAHRHHRDPAYDGTLLHVVWRHDRPTGGRRLAGPAVPMLELSRLEPGWPGALFSAYQRHQAEALAPAWSPAEATRLLQAAGLARFERKAAECQADIVALGAEQALYRRLMAVLGYAANRRPFVRLADLVSLAELRTWVAGSGPDGAACRLRELAGLGERAVPGGLDRGDWALLGLRPGNLPERRIGGLCRLVARFGADWSLALAGAVEDVWRRRRPGALAEMLRVQPSLVGTGRAREMAVNAVLPWAFARGELEALPGLRQAALGCYLGHPRCMDYQVTREAARLLGLPPRAARTACQQQGLLHLYRRQLADLAAWQPSAQGGWRWRPVASG